MATKLLSRVVFVCSLFASIPAWGRPATISVFCPWSTADRTAFSIVIRSAADPEHFAEMKFGVSPPPYALSASGDEGVRRVALRDGWMKIDYAGHLGMLDATNTSPDARVEFSKSGITFANLTVPPNAYQVVATADGPKPINLLDEEVTAASGHSYTFTVEQRTLLADLLDGVLQTRNIPFGIAMLLGAALVAAVKERLKKFWDDLLTSAGKLGVRWLKERSFVRQYLRDLEYNHKYLKLIGLNTAGFSRPLLERVFISLRIASYTRSAVDHEADATVSFASAVGRFPCLAILGAPGAGKTTTLSYTLLQFAANRGRELGIGEPLLPVFIPLRRVSNKNVSLLDDLTDRETQIIPDEVLDECPAGFFERRMANGGCILLLDGLDEVVSEAHHRLVAQKINNLAAKYPNNRYVVTCRIAGWQDLLPGFVVLQTQDLNRDEIHQFIQGWHTAVITDMERSRLRLSEPDETRFEELWRARRDVVGTAIDAQSRRLINAIDGNQRIQAIATNPMLLSLICLVHLNKHILPRGRSLLYRECVELLTDAWDRSRDLVAPDELTYNQKETALRQIALAFQQSGKGELARGEIERVAESVARSLGGTISGSAFVETLERRSGLLIERSIDVLGFSHLTLQEYLVARHIQQNPELLELLTSNFDNRSWREVILLYCGLVDDATPIVSRILQEQSSPRLYLAALCIGESQNCDQGLVKIVVDQLLERLEGGESSDEYLAALAAVAADFKDVRVTHEQRLSVELIMHIGNDDQHAPVAIIAAGQARITQALPVLVHALLHSSPAVSSLAQSAIANFGNLALPHLKSAVTSEKSFGRIAAVLATINTSAAARMLAQSPTPFSWSLLTRMLKNELILDDLLDLSEHDIPHGIAVSERDGWKYKRQPGTGFLKLEFDLQASALIGWAAHKESPSELAGPPSIRFFLPALIGFTRRNAEITLIPEDLAQVGFEVDSTSAPLLKNLTAAIRRNEADLWTTLERAGTSPAVLQEHESLGSRITRYVTVGLATAIYLINLIFLVVIANQEYSSTQKGTFGVVWPTAALSVYLLITLMVLWWRRRRIRHAEFYASVICPLPPFLRRLPSIVPSTPWAGFAMFSAAILIASIIPIWLYAQIAFHRTPGLLDVAIFIGGAAALIGSLAIYYRNVVLKTDFLRQLIMLHPEGRELLRNA